MDLLGPALARVARVEAAAADALSPAEEQVIDGWRLRYNHGVSRRGNSVLAEARGRRPLAWKIAHAEAFFRDRSVVPRVQISPASRPARLDAELAARGWRRQAGALVLWSPVGRGGVPEPDADLLREGRPGGAYLTVQEALMPGAAAWASARAEALLRAGLDPWHVVLRVDGRPRSAGLAVHDPARRMVGVFSLATLPRARGRGGATRVLQALRGFAAEAGAEGLYLQVDVHNRAALRLYARQGFAEHHRYDYRVAQAGDVPGEGP